MCIDGSKESLSAILAAVKIAKGTDSQLHVACCVPSRPPLPHTDNPHVKELNDAVLERRQLRGLMLLDELVEKIEDWRVSVAGSRYEKGQPDREIVRLAEELGAGLIITGGRDRGKIGRALLTIFPYFFGDFSDRVLHRARCPVLACVDTSRGLSVPLPDLMPDSAAYARSRRVLAV